MTQNTLNNVIHTYIDSVYCVSKNKFFKHYDVIVITTNCCLQIKNYKIWQSSFTKQIKMQKLQKTVSVN